MGRVPVLTKKMHGYDIDGVLTTGITPLLPYCVISGRTWAEYDEKCRELAQSSPVYIRGSGAYGDRTEAGHFKAAMCAALKITDFYEDDPVQAKIITRMAPTKVHLVVDGVITDSDDGGVAL